MASEEDLELFLRAFCGNEDSIADRIIALVRNKTVAARHAMSVMQCAENCESRCEAEAMLSTLGMIKFAELCEEFIKESARVAESN